MDNRIVITGIGIVSPIGIGKDIFWDNCLSGVSGVGKISYFDTAQYRTKIAAIIKDFKADDFLEKKVIRKTDRFAHFALAASKLALKDSKLNIDNNLSTRLGIYLGTGLGGMFFYEKQILLVMKSGMDHAHPFSIPMIMPNGASNNIAILLNAKGPNLTVCTACSSSAHSIGLAYDAIRRGRAEIVIAGGAEAPVVEYTFAGFDAMRVMSANNAKPNEASRPFDKRRDGFVMGEGSAMLILESLKSAKARKANIYAEIIGYSATSGAYHFVAPQPDGLDIVRAMDICIREANVDPQSIDYINAHGTSTVANDKVETLAIKKVFKKYANRIPISSTKSMLGHTLGAAGAFEIAVSALSIYTGKIHPTINYETMDAECDLDYVPNKYRDVKVNIALSNSFAFGNNNACIMLRRY